MEIHHQFPYSSINIGQSQEGLQEKGKNARGETNKKKTYNLVAADQKTADQKTADQKPPKMIAGPVPRRRPTGMKKGQRARDGSPQGKPPTESKDQCGKSEGRGDDGGCTAAGMEKASVTGGGKGTFSCFGRLTCCSSVSGVTLDLCTPTCKQLEGHESADSFPHPATDGKEGRQAKKRELNKAWIIPVVSGAVLSTAYVFHLPLVALLLTLAMVHLIIFHKRSCRNPFFQFRGASWC